MVMLLIQDGKYTATYLKGCKDDYFVNEDILKKQKTFIDTHIEIAKPVKK